MSAPTTSAQYAATMTEQLVSLADQAQHWQRALLRTSTEIAALTGGYAGPTHDRPAQSPAAVRARLADLLDGVRTTAWLRAGADDRGRPAGEADPVAELLLRDPQDTHGVHALLGTRRTGETAQQPSDGWRDSAAEIRVVPGDLSRGGPLCDLVLTDRQLAITVSPGADGQLRAETVTDPVVLGLLRAMWDALWVRSLPLAAAVRLDGLMGDGVKSALLEQLGTGTKDEVIARALGISLRTCRRHIAELLTATGAVSRFQAGSRLALAGLFSAPPR